MSNARRILIIDDDDELRESLSEQLTLHEEFETALAATASEGLKQARNGHVDLVLLDVGLPDLDGREACKLLRRGGFKGPIVMLTAQVSDSDTILGLESGANDYVTKPFGMEELLARLRAALRRAQPETEPVLKIGELEIDLARFQAYVGQTSLDFTRREFEVLRLLAGAMGKVLTREEIYEQVWGYRMAHGDRSVDVFVRKLRQKLEKASPRWRYIHTHFGIGYRFAPEAAGNAPATPTSLAEPSAETADLQS